jgi:hypothetical protein
MIKYLPNPAVALRQVTNTDPVTDVDDTPTWETIYLANPTVEQADGESTYLVAYDDGPDQRAFMVPKLVADGQFISTPDGTIRIRDVDPYDAVQLAPSAGIPQPIEVVRAAVLLGGGNLAQELDAVVAADNTVATLLLETGLGTYVRYSGDWQQLSEDSDSLEDMSLVAVGPGAVDIFDAGDAAGHTVSVFDLPMPSGQDGQLVEPGEPEGDDSVALAASGVSIPEINQVEDLDLGIRFASAHPAVRWYVQKRAHALDAADRIPASWGGGVVLPFVTKAAG